MQNRPIRELVKEFIFEKASAPDYPKSPPTEAELAERLGVSRSPVRNVLAQLEREGLITRRKKRGILLRKPDIREIAEIYDARTALEGFAARLAKGKFSAADFALLEQHAAEVRDASQEGNRLRCLVCDIEFHRLLLAKGGNALLATMVENINVLERSFLILEGCKPALPSQDENPANHTAIIETFKNGTADECENIVRHHIQWAKKRMIELVLDITL